MKALSFVLGTILFANIPTGITGRKEGADPCKEYISFPDLDKRDVNYILPASDSPVNDVYIDNGHNWFGEEGYDVVLSPPHANEDRCGTTYPMWINDKLPDKGQEKMVESCIVDLGDNCTKNLMIRVKDCGALRVYQLKASPIFEAAYCVGLTDPKETVSSFTVKPTVNIEVVTDKMYKDHFKFKCQFTKSPDDILYHVLWYVNEGFIHSFPATHWSPKFLEDTALSEDILKDSGYSTVGFNLQCAVKGSLGEGFPAGKGILSEKKFVGIKILDETVVIYEGEEKKVGIQLTAPLGCGPRRDCTMEVFVMARNVPGDCDPSAFVRTECGLKIKGSSWNEVSQLQLLGKTTAGYNPTKTIMRLYLMTDHLVMTHPFWSNYNIGSVTVEVVKNAPVTTQTYCYANQDPHMKTYDGRLYEFHKSGTYVLYKHDELEIEVQMQLLPCFPNKAVRCPCGIAVRAGRTIFHIDRCNRPNWSIGYAECIDGKDLIKVLKSGTKYKIILPTGSRLDIAVQPSSYFFNVHLYPSDDDKDKVSGLCGTFTGRCEDDFKKRNGRYSTAPNAKRVCSGAIRSFDKFDDFGNSWRADVDLFNHEDFDRLKPWSSKVVLCTCDQHHHLTSKLYATATCSTTMNNNVCVFNKNFLPPPSANGQCLIESNRRRRAVMNQVDDRIKRHAEEDDAKTWTETEAKDYCDRLFNKSKSIIVCQNVEGMSSVIEANKHNCIQDIMAIQSTDFAKEALESSKSLCMHEVEMNSTLQEPSKPGVPTVYETLVDITCINDCSERGTCQNGTCLCEAGYGGDDCSRDKSVPPTIYGLLGDGHCDMAKEQCNETSVIGDYFDEFAQIRCRLVPFTINADNVTTTGKRVSSRPLVESFSEAICILPTTRSKRSIDSDIPNAELASGFQISVANYGDVFSDESVLVIYNSNCQSCSVNGKSVSCTFRTQSCTARGVCVEQGGSHPDHPCYTCDASTPIRKWLKKTDAACTITATAEDSSSFPMWIIGAIVGGLLLTGLVIGAFFCYKKNSKEKKSVTHQMQ